MQKALSVSLVNPALAPGRRSALSIIHRGALLHPPVVIRPAPPRRRQSLQNSTIASPYALFLHRLSPPQSNPPTHSTTRRYSSSPPATMSSHPEHPTLLIPGPIEFDDAVLQSMSHYRWVIGQPSPRWT